MPTTRPAGSRGGSGRAALHSRFEQLAVAAGLPKWVKLEIHPDPHYLLPDPVETLAAAEILVKEGFTVLPYINADPVLAKRLEDVGVATVMPLGSPIGSNRGIETRAQIAIIIEQAIVPVVIDAGLGAPSQAAEAMEMGADAVLVNTAIAIASDPNRMARAFKLAVEAGRIRYRARVPQREHAHHDQRRAVLRHRRDAAGSRGRRGDGRHQVDVESGRG